MISNAVIAIVVVIVAVYFIYPEYRRKGDENMQFVASMGAGLNLGNSLDSHGLGKNVSEIEGYETYWGNPVITEETVLAIKKEGFSTIRIPVTWYEHMDEKGNIDTSWMDRVNEVVDYGINNGMYVIIDVHHDDWTKPSNSNNAKAKDLLAKVWKQIAVRFSGYDQHLIFEAVNEPRLIGTKYEWNAGTAEARKIVNEFNQIFVDVVRSVSGNKDRYLMVAPYGDSAELEALNDFVLPKDNRLIVTVHGYKPYDFTHNIRGTKSWDSKKNKDTQEIDEMMSNLYNYFIKNNVPVIIGEFGVINKGNLEARARYTKYYVTSAHNKGIMCIWWDDGGKKNEKEKFGILDRYKNEFMYPEISRELVGNKP